MRRATATPIPHLAMRSASRASARAHGCVRCQMRLPRQIAVKLEPSPLELRRGSRPIRHMLQQWLPAKVFPAAFFPNILYRGATMRKILSATLAASVLAAGAAQAANPTVTTTFQVSATVQPNCTTSATPLGFGNYTPGNGAVTANSTITVNCTKATGYTIWLNPGSTTGDA